MENATKALIIVAAVLIAIVLIAVGIKILGSSSESTNSVDKVTNAMEISVFNSRFEKYKGQQSGKKVKSLLSNVLTTYREGSERNVTVITIENNNGFQQDRECTTVSEISEAMGYLQENYIYEVEILYDDVGYVTRISIS